MPVEKIKPPTKEEQTFRFAFEQYSKGESITDEQLRVLVKYFAKLERTLHLMGKEWRLPWAEASRTLTQLEGWKDARSRDRRL